jgi:osmotically-inducible protein OsmY
MPVALVLAACAGCHAETKTSGPASPRADVAPVESRHEVTPAVPAPETDADRGIRHDLDLAIRRDPHLKDRQISFLVANGDVSVSGVVKDEQERRRINELAMSITGVKSVANALRTAE